MEKKDQDKEKSQKKETKEESTDLKDTLQRLQAEFENFKKRTEKEKEDSMRFAKAQLIGTLLPVVDAFGMALQQKSNAEKFAEGMDIIFNQIMLTLENEGVEPIESIGNQLNPELHDVMMKKPSKEKEGMIIEELQKGYMLGERVLRHAKVVVSEGSQSEKTDTPDNT